MSENDNQKGKNVKWSKITITVLLYRRDKEYQTTYISVRVSQRISIH